MKGFKSDYSLDSVVQMLYNIVNSAISIKIEFNAFNELRYSTPQQYFQDTYFRPILKDKQVVSLTNTKTCATIKIKEAQEVNDNGK